MVAICTRFCSTQEEFDLVFANLKVSACPHCKCVGTLIRHGVLRGNGQGTERKSVRAYRIFCSNRSRAKGCGRTFSIWLADKVKRLRLNANDLWTFLKQAVTCGNKMQAFRSLNWELSDSAPYRIWKRFVEAQAAIRTALHPMCKPPDVISNQPAATTLAHLEAAFTRHPCGPIAAFQATLQTSFL